MENNTVLDKINNINISTEVKNSFLDYAMSVIISRAIPDVRDGLKPVHRRILYTFYNEGILSDKPHKKSATTVGKVMAYHPHGDAAIYDTMARMAQDFTYRYMLVDGKGAFGAPDGSSPAAARYTEARLSKISNELLRDINKDAIDFVPNYDGETIEPTVLPSRFPNILVNGNMGIAVGMATKIPPHNLSESVDAIVAYIDNPDISVLELMQFIKGPDFPTGGIILGNSGIRKAYETGKGSITIRSKIEIEEKQGKTQLIITEIPYETNYTMIIRKIAELVRDKQIDGISNLTDASALEGIRIVIDVKNGYNPNVLLNNLYKLTQLQASFGINFLMLVNGKPQTIGIKDIIRHYLDHQMNVVIRRTKFDLEKSERQCHILEGYKIALNHIDEIIKTIKSSNDDKEIIAKFYEIYGLTEEQSQAILEMKLRRLSGLERAKIEEELRKLLELIEKLRFILSSNKEIQNVVKQELIEIKEKYGDERRTRIDMTAIEYIDDESLIPVENIVVTLTNKGYVKRVVEETYKTQNRGGVGVKGMATNDEDFVQSLITLTTHDYILFFSNKGKVYRVKGYEIPEYSRQAKGLPIVNLLPLVDGEIVNSTLSISNDDRESNLIFATRFGFVKRAAMTEFENIRSSGKIAITLKEGDELIGVRKTNGSNEIALASSTGRMVRFNEEEVRVMGRTASGVRGININVSKGSCVGIEIAEQNKDVLVVTENGYGKRTPVDEYRMTHRGSKGVMTLNTTERNGSIVSFKVVDGEQDLIIITNSGMLIRIPVSQISVMSRVTQGVRLITLKDDQKVTAVFNVLKEESVQEEEEQ